jgi:hypothetical protein
MRALTCAGGLRHVDPPARRQRRHRVPAGVGHRCGGLDPTSDHKSNPPPPCDEGLIRKDPKARWRADRVTSHPFFGVDADASGLSVSKNESFFSDVGALTPWALIFRQITTVSASRQFFGSPRSSSSHSSRATWPNESTVHRSGALVPFSTLRLGAIEHRTRCEDGCAE